MGSKAYNQWYGDWTAVVVATLIFGLFTLALVRPRKKRDWRATGILQAFFISLFAEMFGLPLTIYLLSSLLGTSYRKFGLYESHLWAYLISKLGVMKLGEAVRLVMDISIVLIGAGALLIAIGWVQIFRGKGNLVTGGIYRIIRHPQYLGLILIIIAFNVQWPTIVTVVMAPILIVTYLRLAKIEDKESEEKFGDAYETYRKKVNGFIPRVRARLNGQKNVK